jgi:hypothetical protein
MKPESREIKLSLETATRWYNGNDNELKELALQTFPELAIKKLPKSWEELGKISGYYMTKDSEIKDIQSLSTYTNNYNIFVTENQAKSAIAMAKLSQVMAVYNDGWVADWNDKSQKKWSIYFFKDSIVINELQNTKNFLMFKTQKIAEEFLNNFREDIETYFNF